MIKAEQLPQEYKVPWDHQLFPWLFQVLVVLALPGLRQGFCESCPPQPGVFAKTSLQEKQSPPLFFVFVFLNGHQALDTGSTLGPGWHFISKYLIH